MKTCVAAFALTAVLATPPARAQDAKGVAAAEAPSNQSQPVLDRRATERAKIEAAVESYIVAFNAKDVAKLVSHWSPEGAYVSRTDGSELVGYEALTKEFTAILSGEDAPNLAVQTESIEFISPNVALERGAALVTRGDDKEESSYRAVYVKRDGRWLIDRVTEDASSDRPSNYDRLKQLEFLVGHWVDDDGENSVEIECQWTANQNYISRKYRVSSSRTIESSGLQIIGWDPAQEQIRSWLFDSDGGFVKGVWTPREDAWSVQSIATFPDGAKGSFTSVFQPTADGNYTWQKLNRVLDGALLPNTDQVHFLRK